MAPEIRELPLNSEQLEDVAAHFLESARGYYIIKIDEVINELRDRKYEAHRSFLVDSRVDPNERRLFHGTDPKNIPKIHLQGFNRNFSGIHGVNYGRGAYFARDASYSARYCPAFNGSRTMCVCNVLVGCPGQGSNNLVVPPRRPFSDDPNVLCDSTVNHLENPTIFVCYHDDQVCKYPTYFTVDMNQIVVFRLTSLVSRPYCDTSSTFEKPVRNCQETSRHLCRERCHRRDLALAPHPRDLPLLAIFQWSVLK